MPRCQQQGTRERQSRAFPQVRHFRRQARNYETPRLLIYCFEISQTKLPLLRFSFFAFSGPQRKKSASAFRNEQKLCENIGEYFRKRKQQRPEFKNTMIVFNEERVLDV